MRGLRLLLRSPRLVLGVVVLYLLLAAALSRGLGQALARSLAPFAPLSEGRVLATLLDLALTHSGHLGQLAAVLQGSAVLGLLIWTLLVGGVIAALDRRLSAPEVAAASLRHLPQIALASLWHLLLRAALLALAGLLSLLPGPAGQVSVLVAWVGILGFSACAHDLARVAVVLEGQRSYWPAVAWGGFLRAARNPRLVLVSVFFSLIRWSLLIGSALVAVAFFGQSWTPWAVRAMAVVAIVAGLARLAVAVAFVRRVPRQPAHDRWRKPSSSPAPQPQQGDAEAIA